jgi:hypothetical protein
MCFMEETTKPARFIHDNGSGRGKMKPHRHWTLLAALAALGAAADAQLVPPVRLPPVGGVVTGLGDTGRDVLDRTVGAVERVGNDAETLARARRRRLESLVRQNPERLEMTRLGPALRGEVIAVDPDPAALAAAEAAGFARLGEDRMAGLGLRVVILSAPRGWSVDRAIRRLGRIAPAATFAAAHLYAQAGAVGRSVGRVASTRGGTARTAPVGMIDGGVGTHPSLAGRVVQRGFVRGAPRPSAHGTAVASLIVGQAGVRGADPGAPLFVADIYGADPAGGNALALARALGWMAVEHVPVVAMSLVGPPNPLVARAVARARARGVRIVAPVGNDGRAAPPAYPASYPGVIAVTAVDARNRPLIEAGRALHLDYAAPGADMAAAAPGGGLARVRGTSFAVPLVAGRLATHLGAADPLAALDAEANPRGPGLGRGVVCRQCRTPWRGH